MPADNQTRLLRIWIKKNISKSTETIIRGDRGGKVGHYLYRTEDPLLRKTTFKTKTEDFLQKNLAF